jgi:predicted metal-binding membrane protein
LERVVRRDRAVVIVALATVVAASWGFTLTGAGMGMTAFEMTAMSSPVPTLDSLASAGMMAHQPWDSGYAGLMVLMWWVMMIAMMIPSAAPMILLFARVSRHSRDQAAPFVSTGVFVAGYLAVWGAFSLLATGLQWALESAGLMSAGMTPTSAWLAAGLLIAAGLYQVTPVKQACLRHCRGPFSFLMERWRPGSRGALRMGWTHGAYCLGCCWFLMGLLFAGGVMNLYWVAGLAAFVLLEKSIPYGHWLAYVTGGALTVWGLIFAVRAW